MYIQSEITLDRREVYTSKKSLFYNPTHVGSLYFIQYRREVYTSTFPHLCSWESHPSSSCYSLVKCSTMIQTWNFVRACELCARKNFVRLWKDLCNFSKIICGSKFFESFPQNMVSFPQIGIFKAFSPWFDESILIIVDINRLKILIFLRKPVNCWFWLAEELYRIPCLPGFWNIQLDDFNVWY